MPIFITNFFYHKCYLSTLSKISFKIIVRSIMVFSSTSNRDVYGVIMKQLYISSIMNLNMDLEETFINPR